MRMRFALVKSARPPSYPLAAAVVVAALGAMAVPTDAAMCMDISTEPPRPVAQNVTTVLMREQWAVISGNSFALVARRDGHADIPISVSRLSTGSLTWGGQLVFPQAGEWKLRVAIAHPDNHYPCFEAAVVVAPAGTAADDTSDRAPLVLAAVAALGLALAIAAASGSGRGDAGRPRRSASGP